MALSNESYIVYTATSGEVIVPIREAVPYLNVTFIGYQYYSYHTLMSQNMANLADDIKALQDGGLAQATFDLEALIQEAKDEIDLQILGIESGLNDKIIFLTDQAVSNTNTQLGNFNTELYGDGVTTFGLVGIIDTLTNETDGLVNRVDIIETAVGDENSGGLVQQFNGITGIVTDLAIVVGSETSGLVEDVLILENKMDNVSTGVLPRLIGLESILGDINVGLIHQINLNKDILFGDGSYEGLFNIIGDNTAGLVKYAQDTRLDLNNLTSDSGIRLTSIEIALGHLSNTGITSDVDDLQTQQQIIRDSLGDTDASGLRLRVADIEGLNVQVIRDTVYGDGDSIPGLVSDSADLRTDVDALAAASSGFNGSVTDELAVINTKIDTNIDDIDNIEITMASKISELDVVKDNLNNATTGVNYQLANMNTTIEESLLTHNTLLFTPSILNDMKIVTDSVSTNDIVAQFQTYFGTVGNYLAASELGLAPLTDWIDDTLNADGYKLSTETIIDNHLGTGSGISQVTANQDAITLLNSSDATVGSVDNSILQAKDEINDNLYGVSGSITILNSNNNVSGSVSKTVEDIIGSYDSVLQSTTILDLQNQIDQLESENGDLQLEIKESTSEIQVEMVRYDTILPFLQSMFKRVNSDGEILDSEIDTIFDTVGTKVAALSATLSPKDAIAYFTDNGGAGLNTFDLSIILDRDLHFVDLSSAGGSSDDFIIIERVSDSYRTFGTLGLATLEAGNNLVVESGIYLEILEARVYENENDATGVEVLDLTETYNVTYATSDIFGQIKIHEYVIEARP